MPEKKAQVLKSFFKGMTLDPSTISFKDKN
jgi:hypothetical protein